LAAGDVILALPAPELLKNGFVILLRAIVFSQRNCDYLLFITLISVQSHGGTQN
jgi:hypothetical protein